MGDHPAAIHCGLSRLPLFGRGVIVLCRDPEAEEGRWYGSSARLRAALLKRQREDALVEVSKLYGADFLIEIEAVAAA